MRTNFVLVIFFFILSGFSLSLYAQNGSIPFSFTKKQIGAIQFISSNYSEGSYREVITLTSSGLKKYSKESLATLVPFHVYQALAHHALFNTIFANSSITKIETEVATISNPFERTSVSLELARYYFTVGYYSYSQKLLESIEPIPSFQYELDLRKTQLLVATGFFKSAYSLIQFKNVSGKTPSNDIGVWIKDAKQRATYLSTLQSQWFEIETSLYIQQGFYDKADSILKDFTTWSFTSELPKAELQKTILTLKATLAENRKSYAVAADYYTSAYTLGTDRPDGQRSIFLLTNIIVNLYRSNNSLQATSYLRRLQMIAYQSVGKFEQAQLAYEYAESFKSFSENNPKEASKRLLKLLVTYSSIEANNWLLISSIALLSELYETTGQLESLLANEAKKVARIERYSGESSMSFHQAQLRLALFELAFGKNFKLANAIMHRSYDQAVKTELDGTSPFHIPYLIGYADLYMKLEKLDSALYRSTEVIRLSELNYGKQSLNYLLASSRHAEFLMAAGRYPKALLTLQEVGNALENVNYPQQITLQKIYLILANLNRIIGEFDLSKKMLDKALTIDNRAVNKDFFVQAETSEQLALLYLQTNNYYRAEKFATKSYSLKREKLHESNPLFYSTYLLLAALKSSLGDLAAIEPLLKKASTLLEEVYGKNSLIGIDVKKAYADYYYSINDVKKAEAIYLETDKLVIEKLGKSHLKHAALLLEILSIKAEVSSVKPVEIENLYKEILSIVKNALGNANPLYMDIIARQAKYFINVGKYKEAEILLTDLETFWKAKLGNESEYLALVFDLRGDIAYKQNRYELAEANYLKSKSIYQAVYNDSHKEYMLVYAKLAKVYFMNKNPEKSIAIMDEIIPNYLEFTTKYFPSMSFRQKANYWNSIKDEFEFYNTLAFNSSKSNEVLWEKAYNNILATKAILLSSGVKLLNQIMSSEDSILISLYNDWVSKKEFLLTVLYVPKKQLEEQGIELSKIESEIDLLEKQMSAQSTIFSKEERKKKLTTWEDVRSVLNQQEYSVEIIRYRKFSKVFSDSIYYASLVLKKGATSPVLVLSNNGLNMEKRNLNYYRNTTANQIEDEFSYDVYWSKIKAHLPDGAQVYFSGDGVYNQLNIEMLRHYDNLYAIDENQFIFISTTKDLVQLSNEQSSSKKSKENKKESTFDYLLCGSPTFYDESSTVTKKTIADLPGTEKEIVLINALLTNASKKSITILGSSLTEDTLKQVKNPKVVHIATHGYFAERTSSNEDNIATSPLLNSGIMLASSGEIIDNKESKYVNQQSGILTAYEAMNLTLDNTDLVVLSACETGRGEIQVGEGVAGLQRSFLLAGSKAIIVSLFKVNDEVTQKLMTTFYEKWLLHGDKRRAFVEAKLEVKRTYPEPIFWGAFMMIEGKLSRHQLGN